MEKKEVMNLLIKNGATSVRGLKIKNITVTPCENYVRIGITLDQAVAGYVTNDNGVTYEKGDTKTIFVSLFSLVSILKDDDDVAFAANHIVKNPDSIQVILNRASIDILQENVTTGTDYKNPWSDNAESVTFDHDTIINHVVDIKLSDFAKKKLDKLADAMLGF